MGCMSFLMKNFIFVVNFVFAVGGICLIITGMASKFGNPNLSDTPSEFNASIIMVLIVGILLLITSYLGCCGAKRENVCLLRTYAALLVIIFIFHVIIGIIVFVASKNSEFKTNIEDSLKIHFMKYHFDKDDRRFVDSLQEGLKCCGLHDPGTWHGQEIPSSCCADKPRNCTSTNEDLYIKGCSEALYTTAKTTLTILGYVTIGILVAELLAAIFGFYLARMYQEEEY